MSRGPTCSASWSTKSSPFQGIADMIESPLDQTSPPVGAAPPAGLREMGKKRHAGPGNGPRNRSVSGNVCGSSDKGGLLRWDQMEGALQDKKK